MRVCSARVTVCYIKCRQSEVTARKRDRYRFQGCNLAINKIEAFVFGRNVRSRARARLFSDSRWCVELLHVSGKTSRTRCLWGSINSERFVTCWNCLHRLTSPRGTSAVPCDLFFQSYREDFTVALPGRALELYGDLIDGYSTNML